MNKEQKAREGALAIEVEKEKSYHWCSYGKSFKQPFCDGLHKGTEFKHLVYKAELAKRLFFFVYQKQMINLFVMARITKSNIANQNIRTIFIL